MKCIYNLVLLKYMYIILYIKNRIIKYINILFCNNKTCYIIIIIMIIVIVFNMMKSRGVKLSSRRAAALQSLVPMLHQHKHMSFSNKPEGLDQLCLVRVKSELCRVCLICCMS